MSGQKAYKAEKIFTGDEWLHDHVILVEDGIIKDRLPAFNYSGTIAEDFKDGLIAPAFIDLQIYGAYGKLFVAYPDAEALHLLNAYCNKGGAAFCMPTVATNTYQVIFKCIDAVKKYWQQGGEGILGLHIEGPWINAAKRGAHVESLIHSPSMKQAEDLLNYGKGVIKIITLAPEVCGKEVIDLILEHNIIISAGHSNATYAEATAAFANGITAVTHLYNAMSTLHHREPGLPGAVFNNEKIMGSIIADGYHTDYAAIQIAKKIMHDRLFAITDAVTETSTGLYHHKLDDEKYIADGILSGSALTMAKALQNLVKHVHIDLPEALRMCSMYPARLMNLNKLGRIQKDYEAKLVVLDSELLPVKIL